MGKPLLLACLALALRTCTALMMAGFVAGCTFAPDRSKLGVEPPAPQVVTSTLSALRSLPPPDRALHVAVYRFADQTGQTNGKALVARHAIPGKDGAL